MPLPLFDSGGNGEIYIMKIVKSLVMLFGLLPALSLAQRYDVLVDVGDIRYHEASVTLAEADWQKGVWFALKNPSLTLSNCAIYNGDVIVSIPDGNDTALSILLSAKMASRKVLVTVDSDVKYRGYCRLQYITLR